MITMIQTHFKPTPPTLAEVTIQRPPLEVFDYMTQVENAPGWISGVLEYTGTPEGAGRVGTELQYLLRLAGQRVEVREYVQVADPPQRYVVIGTAGPFAYRLTYTFDSVPAGVRVRLALQGLSQGWPRLVEPLLWLAWQYRARRDLKRLKHILEQTAVLA